MMTAGEQSSTVTRPPDFIIGGAPRSGTTWLYQALDRHPEVFLARPLQPEPKFFLIDDIYDRGWAYYLENWFSSVPEGAVAGEKSTNYLESAIVAERIHRHLPSVRLIFILREPAERALSNWRWTTMNGLEDLSFEEAIEAEREREANYPPALRYARPNSYFSRGLYARLLQPYIERFPRSQLLCLRYEDILRDPGALMDTVHQFLGVEKRGNEVTEIGVINASEPAEADRRTLDTLRASYEAPNRALTELLPDFEVWGK